jgi:TonB-dependent receptor
MHMLARRSSTIMRLKLGETVSAIALAFVIPVTASAQTTPQTTPSTDQDTVPVGAGVSKPPVSNSTDLATQAVPDQPNVTPADTEAPASADVVVTGLRQSLANAQSIKRNADTVVDAISAEDIGALPDRSINEALQRVPGVAISRFAAPNDSQHFSVQGSGVTIRGLDGYALSEFNGRDTFGVSAGRGIGYNDVPSELAGSVEVFKNLTSDMIEGGISGTVSINTRKPFDQKGQVIYLSGAVNYGDLEKQSSPSIVGLYSNQWETSGGSRFGALIGGSFDQLRSRADSVFLSSFLPRFNAPNDGVDGYAPDGVDYQGTQYDGNLCDGNNPNEGRIINAGQPYAIRTCDAFQTPNGKNTVYTPLGAGVRTQDFNIKRKSFEGALQFENPSRSLLVTANYLRADYTEDWIEHTIEPNVYYNDIGNTFPLPGTNYTFDDDGVFTSGQIQRINNQQAHNVPAPGCIIPNNGNPYSSNYCPYTQFVNPSGINTDFSNRHFYTHSLTQDASLNIKFEPTARLHLNLDGQYVDSQAQNIDDTVDIYTLSNVGIDLTGRYPQVSFLTPGFDTQNYFLDPGTHYYNDASNNRADNSGSEYSFRGDAQYDLSEDAFFRALRVGGRYAKREQTLRTTNYTNWGSLSATWTDQGPSFLSGTPNALQDYNFPDFFRGDAVQPPTSPYIKDSILEDHDALTALLRQAKDNTNSGQFSYIPIEDGGGHCAKADLVDTYFCPSQIYKNSEEVWAGYARLDFGTHEFGGGMKLSGNVGVRFVHTTDKSVGAISFPLATQVIPASYNGVFTNAAKTGYCDVSARPNPNTGALPSNIPFLCQPGTTDAQRQAILAFATGASVPQTATQNDDQWLPSLNLRFDITPKLLARFAASKAIVRPNFGDLANYVTIGYDATGGTFSARASNPNLQPIQAKQLDLTLEWYFNKVGSLTGTLFYKDLTNVILANSGFNRTVDNNGTSYTIGLTGPANAAGHVRVKGAEASYQQTFDFLPGVLSGFGAQATYTYIDAGSVLISPPSYQAPTTPYTGNGAQPPLDITGLYDNLPLPGLSKHTFNISGFYDKFGLYARVAYNWRSKFLLTSQDCCFPYLPVYQLSSGTLDASLFYTVNKYFKIGIQGSNLIDTTTKTSFLLNGAGLEAPRSYFKSDRQFNMSVRLTL